MTESERHTLARSIARDPQRAADEMIQLRALLAEALPHLETYASVTGIPSVSDLVKRMKQADPKEQ